MISLQRFKELVHYDPQTGVFTARVDRTMIKAGTVLGSPSKKGHLQFMLDSVMYKAHRMAFYYMGQPIPEQVDHIDGNPKNNAWANLRPATALENARNSRKRKDNTSGYKGVYWHKQTEMWRARIQVNGYRIHLGSFGSPDDAHLAYLQAAKKYHGEFANGG